MDKAKHLPEFTAYVVDGDTTDIRLVNTVNDCVMLLAENDNRGIRIIFKIGKAVSFFFALKEQFGDGRPTWAELEKLQIFKWFVCT